MITQRLCPRCGADGDVFVSGAGIAGCRKCQGGFASTKIVGPALLSVGVAPEAVRDLIKQGSATVPCCCCGKTLVSFTVRNERAHLCQTCAAMWLDEGALLR